MDILGLLTAAARAPQGLGGLLGAMAARQPPAALGAAPAAPAAGVAPLAPAASSLGAPLAAPQPAPQPAPMAGFTGVANAGAGWTEVLLPDGTVERRTGTRAWRNNNPGNIEFGDFARSHGAVGTDGRFAVFPTYDLGRAAKEALLFESPSYRDRTIASAIARYAPSFENDTGSYTAQVAAAAGVSPNTPLSALTADQRSAMLDAMERVEGFRPGSVNGAPAPSGDTRMASAGAPAAPMSGGGGSMALLGNPAQDVPRGGLLGGAAQPQGGGSIFDRLAGVPVLGGLANPDRRARLAMALEGMTLSPNQQLMDSLQGGIDQRADDARLERIASWLGSMPGGQPYAEAIAAGMDPTTAYAAYSQSQAPQDPIVTDGGLVLSSDGTSVIGDYRDQPGGAGAQMTGAQVMQQFPGVQADPAQLYNVSEDGAVTPVGGTGAPTSVERPMRQDQYGIWRYADDGSEVFPGVQPPNAGAPNVDGESAMRAEWNALPQVRAYAEVSAAYNNLATNASLGTGAGDIALITGFQKLLDPGSVVREQEFATASNVGGLLERANALLSGVQSGTLLTPATRNELMTAANAIYQEAQQREAALRGVYTSTAQSYGYDPSRTLIDYGQGIQLWQPPAAPPPGAGGGAPAAPAAGAAPAALPPSPAPAAAPPGALPPSPTAPATPMQFPSPAAIPQMPITDLADMLRAAKEAGVQLPADVMAAILARPDMQEPSAAPQGAL